MSLLAITGSLLLHRTQLRALCLTLPIGGERNYSIERIKKQQNAVKTFIHVIHVIYEYSLQFWEARMGFAPLAQTHSRCARLYTAC